MPEIDWSNPYYVTISLAEALSDHARGHIYYMARKGIIASLYLNESRNADSMVVSLRDILIYERDANRRGQSSVVEVLSGLVSANIYAGSPGELSRAANLVRGRGVSGRLKQNEKLA